MRIPAQNESRHWPLPADYGELTSEGKRRARVALCQSYYDPAKPTKLITNPYNFIVAFIYWRETYRKGWPGNSHKYTVDDAPAHREWVEIIANHRRSVITSFRGSGKTMKIGEELPEFLLTTRPRTAISYMTAGQDLAEDQIMAVRQSLTNNDLLINDFGRMQPYRGEGRKWTDGFIECRNMSTYRGISFQKRQRGMKQQSMRPLVGIMDDWEVDKRVKNPVLSADAEDYLFNVYFNMFEPGAWFVWGNTLLGHAAWAMKATMKLDKRFKHWFSKQYYALYNDEKGVERSFWPARWSVEDLKAMRSGEGNEKVVGLGEAAFSQEMMNKPTSKDAIHYALDLTKHTYRWEGTAEERWLVTGTGKRIRYEELVERSIGVIGTDLALGIRNTGSFNAAAAARQDDDGVLWFLEEYQGHCKPMELLRRALIMSEYWGAVAIGIERVYFEQVAIDALEEELHGRRLSGLHAPEINVILRGGGESKAFRAMGLEYRFIDNKIMIPLPNEECALEYARGTPNLLEQFQNFTPLGGRMQWFDALDAAVAIQDTLQKIGRVASSPKRTKTMLEVMKEYSKHGGVYWPGSQNVDAAEMAREREMEKRRAATSIHDPDMAGIMTGLSEDWDESPVITMEDF